MKKKILVVISIFLLLIIFINFSLYFGESLRIKNFKQTNNFETMEGELRSSDNGKPALNYSAFFQNTNSVYRLFESIKFDINTASFPYANYSILKIDYSDNTNDMLLMDYVSGTYNFTYNYTPKYNTPLGFHNISFLIYNISDDLLSSDIPITNFTVRTNYMLSLNSSDYYKDNYVYGELMVNNEPSPYTFNWNITVVDNDNETLANNTLHINNNVQQFLFRIDNNFECSNKQYFIKLNLSDSINAILVQAYFPFTVLNSNPEIDISSIIFSSSVLKRTEVCSLTFNVSDPDFNTIPENLTASITIKNSLGFSQLPISLINNNNWSFTGTFSIESNNPIGTYELTIELEDQYGGTDSYTKLITIENNPPEIYSYTINGFSMEQSIEVDYGDDIVFTFNVSDIEDSITYISVHLLNENDEWYNITKAFIQNLEFTIRTEELLIGVWLVYISVTDIDGDTTYLTSDYEIGPQELRIIPDILSPIIPWIAFFIGIVLGVLAGLLIPYKKFKTKFEEVRETPPKKSANDIKPKRKQKQLREEEAGTKEEKPEEIEEFDESKQIPQRRIKRKLK